MKTTANIFTPLPVNEQPSRVMRLRIKAGEFLRSAGYNPTDLAVLPRQRVILLAVQVCGTWDKFVAHVGEQLKRAEPVLAPAKPAKKPTVAQVRQHCRNLRVPFRRIAETGEFVVGGYYTDDAQDAMDTATHIAAQYVPLR